MVEPVFTVTDWYDGPRRGVALFDGRPHAFESLFDDDRFRLWPIDDAVLALALEDWAIWRRWEKAFHAGEAPHGSHPALPADRARHEALTGLLDPLTSPGPSSFFARGRFEPSGEDNGHASYRVEWAVEQ